MGIDNLWVAMYFGITIAAAVMLSLCLWLGDSKISWREIILALLIGAWVGVLTYTLNVPL